MKGESIMRAESVKKNLERKRDLQVTLDGEVMNDEEEMNDYPLVAWHKIRNAIVTISSMLSEDELMKFNFEDWLASQEDVKLERAVANSPYLRSRALDYIRSKQNEKIVQQLC